MAVSHTPTLPEEALKGRMIIKDSCLTSDSHLRLRCVSIYPVDCTVLDHLGRCSQLSNKKLEWRLRQSVPLPFSVSRTNRSLYFELSHLFNYLVKFFSRGMVFGSTVWQWTESRLEKTLVRYKWTFPARPWLPLSPLPLCLLLTQSSWSF